MKHLVAAMTALSLISAGFAQSSQIKPAPGAKQMTKLNDVGTVSPALEHYTQARLLGEVWKRPGLSSRDRSLVTVSAIIAAGQVVQIPYHLNRAMDNGLTQAQASEVITHLAFYVGWPNVFSALPVAKEVFEKRTR
jgi:4-carboxymuconolactone decarboxylase